jgi:hypothetical protein
LREGGAECERVGGDPALGASLEQCGLVAIARQASVRERLLDDHRQAGCLGASECLCARGLEQVPGRLDGVEEIELDCGVDGLSLVGSGDGHPDGDRLLPQATHRAEHLA